MEFNATDGYGIVPEMVVRHPYAMLLVGAYGLAAICIMLFFAVEDGCWHYSRRVETIYLSCVLLVVYTTSVMLGFPYVDLERTFENPLGPCSLLFELPCSLAMSDEEELAYSRLGVLAVQHVVLLLVMVFIMARHVAPVTMKAYYEEIHVFGGGDARLSKLAAAQPVMVRWARELNECLCELEDSIEDPVLFPSSTLGLCLLSMALLMLNDVVVAIPSLGKVTFIFASAVSVIMWIHIAWTLWYAWRVYGEFADKCQRLLRDIVKEGNGNALKYLFACVSLRCLLEVSRDVLELLYRDALEGNLLGNTEKAMFIYALQNIGLCGSRRRQEAVKQILLSTVGQELTELKKLLDGTGNYHNLYKLVYHDISYEVVRSEILTHIQKQSKVVRQRPGHIAGIKVCSDIDDTLYSSGGHFPAGCDKRFPKGVVYPGCLTLFKVLDKSWQPNAPSSNLAFLSARPHVYKSWAEKKSYDFFLGLVEEGRLHSIPTMIPGQLGLGLWAMLTYACVKNVAWSRVGEFKYQTYKRFARLYLEYDFVFCGDDGQGDLWAGQRMTQNGRSEKPLDEFMDETSDDDEEADNQLTSPSEDSSPSSSSEGDQGHETSSSSEQADSDGRCDIPRRMFSYLSPRNRSRMRTTSSIIWAPLGERNASIPPSNPPRMGQPPSQNVALRPRKSVRTASFHPDELDEVEDEHPAGGDIGNEDAVEHEASLAALSRNSFYRGLSASSWGSLREQGGRIRCVLIHEVLDKSKRTPLTTGSSRRRRRDSDEAWRNSMRDRKLLFHGTYVGAACALHCCDPSLVSLAELLEVAQDAMQEFEEVRLMYPEMGEKWDDVERHLSFDLRQADMLLIDGGHAPLRVLRSTSEVEHVEAADQISHVFSHTRRARCSSSTSSSST